MKDLIYTVSEVTGIIRKTLEDNVGFVSVQGEVSNYTHHSSGHRYFSIKDEGAQISCVMWRTRPVNFQLSDGMKVIVSGKLTVYPQRGNYQLDCTSIRPMGQGDLFLAYEALKKKLEEAGFFDDAHKIPIPEIPLKIGIATSPTVAALQDMKTTIARRFPVCEIVFRPTICQGDESARDIAKAIREFQDADIDVLIIGRGGGSIEDLWSFNTEIVANAIYNSVIPIISAVGHETDFTIADFVADLRAPTPTAAGELVTPFTVSAFKDFLDSSGERMNDSMKTKIDEARKSVRTFVNSYGIRRFSDKIKNQQQYIDDLQSRTESDLNRQFKRYRTYVTGFENHLFSLNPLNPLNRGFALIRNEQGEYLNQNNEITIGSTIIIERKHDELTTEIKQIKQKEKNEEK